MKFHLILITIFSICTVGYYAPAQTVLRPTNRIRNYNGNVDTEYYRYTSNARGGAVLYDNVYPASNLPLSYLYEVGQLSMTSISCDTALDIQAISVGPNNLVINQYSITGDILSSIDKNTSYSTQGVFKNRSRTSYLYASGHLAERAEESWVGDSAWQPAVKFIYSYSSQGKAARRVMQLYDSTGWYNYRSSIYYYDPFNRLISIQDSSWNRNTSTWIISYWGANYHYTASGDLDSAYLLVPGAGTSVKSNQCSWQYNNAHDPVIYISGDNPTNLSKDSFIYDSNHRCIMVFHQHMAPAGGGFYPYVPYGVDTIAYVGNQLLEVKGSTGGTSSFPNFSYVSIHYNYESYIPSGISAVPASAKISLWPNPASRYMAIEVAWNDARDFDVKVIDASGRLLGREILRKTKNYKSKIDLQDYVGGNYFLVVHSGNMESSKPFTVAK